MSVFLLLLISAGLVLIFILLFNRSRRTANTLSSDVSQDKIQESANEKIPAIIGDFYDTHSAAFLKVYGDTIQAFRTVDISTLLNHQAAAMNLRAGMRILDAGCGVCGPAIYFATHFGVAIDAVTISAKQAAIAKGNIESKCLTEQIKVYQGDYHQLPALFPAPVYDVVYFLESFGHSHNKGMAIESAWNMLKPGGLLYIKDLFAKESGLPVFKKQIAENIGKINKAYHYQISGLCEVLTLLRKKNFILSSVKTIDIPLEEFENLSISNEFQALTGINRIDDLQQYVFPVDFFELSCTKPWYDPVKGNGRYFLQNLYHLQVLNHSEEEL